MDAHAITVGNIILILFFDNSKGCLNSEDANTCTKCNSDY